MRPNKRAFRRTLGGSIKLLVFCQMTYCSRFSTARQFIVPDRNGRRGRGAYVLEPKMKVSRARESRGTKAPDEK